MFTNAVSIWLETMSKVYTMYTRMKLCKLIKIYESLNHGLCKHLTVYRFFLIPVYTYHKSKLIPYGLYFTGSLKLGQ